jgi:hypothetical protein
VRGDRGFFVIEALTGVRSLDARDSNTPPGFASPARWYKPALVSIGEAS